MCENVNKTKMLNRDFDVRFRALCRERCVFLNYESLAYHVRECQEILVANRSGIDSFLVSRLIQIYLEECQAECLRRIEAMSNTPYHPCHWQ